MHDYDRMSMIGIVILAGLVVVLLLGAMIFNETKPLTVRITNTSDEPLPVELYINGVMCLNDTIDPKSYVTYDYKNGFWGPGETQVVVKLPNTLYEKEGWGGDTLSFVFE